MSDKTIGVIWAISLLVMVVATVVVAAGAFLELPVPDAAVRVAGALDIVAIGFFTFASVRRNRMR